MFSETGLGQGATVFYAVTGSAFILQVILFIILAVNFYRKCPIVEVNRVHGFRNPYVCLCNTQDRNTVYCVVGAVDFH